MYSFPPPNPFRVSKRRTEDACFNNPIIMTCYLASVCLLLLAVSIMGATVVFNLHRDYVDGSRLNVSSKLETRLYTGMRGSPRIVPLVLQNLLEQELHNEQHLVVDDDMASRAPHDDEPDQELDHSETKRKIFGQTKEKVMEEYRGEIHDAEFVSLQEGEEGSATNMAVDVRVLPLKTAVSNDNAMDEASSGKTPEMEPTMTSDTATELAREN